MLFSSYRIHNTNGGHMEEHNLGVKPAYYNIYDHETYLGRPDLERTRTRYDSGLIRDTFEDLGFKGPDIIYDAKRHEIFDRLTNVFSGNLHNHEKVDDYGAIFVVILTHGQEGYVLTAHDGLYQFTALFDELMQCAALNSLKDKPKVFIFQACNGPERDHGTDAWSTGVSKPNINYSPHPFLLPALPNVLLGFSSAPGYKSRRNVYIPMLCQNIAQYGDHYDMNKLLTLTRQDVADTVYIVNGKECKQIPITISNLTKTLRLRSAAN